MANSRKNPYNHGEFRGSDIQALQHGIVFLFVISLAHPMRCFKYGLSLVSGGLVWTRNSPSVGGWSLCYKGAVFRPHALYRQCDAGVEPEHLHERCRLQGLLRDGKRCLQQHELCHRFNFNKCKCRRFGSRCHILLCSQGCGCSRRRKPIFERNHIFSSHEFQSRHFGDRSRSCKRPVRHDRQRCDGIQLCRSGLLQSGQLDLGADKHRAVHVCGR